jgi:hypothetical protein
MIKHLDGTFRVEVYTPENQLLQDSIERLPLLKALAFATNIIANRFPTHIHWEHSPNS